MSSVLRGSDDFDTGKQLGVGQTWQDVTASRVAGVTYTNTTDLPIQVIVNTSAINAQFTIDGLAIDFSQTSGLKTLSIIVPVGSTYSTNDFFVWLELRQS